MQQLARKRLFVLHCLPTVVARLTSVLLLCRFFHFEHCPVSAASDLAVMEWGSPGKLRLEALQGHHILRAPRALGDRLMSASTLIQHIGKLLRDSGVPCDLTTREGGKNTVTHHCKQYSLNLAALTGTDYANIQWIASHDRDVTRSHYLALCTDAIHRLAGFGPAWSSAHTLGRAVAVPAEFLEVAVPGLTLFLQHLRAGHPQHPLIATVEALDWLRSVWVQVSLCFLS